MRIKARLYSLKNTGTVPEMGREVYRRRANKYPLAERHFASTLKIGKDLWIVLTLMEYLLYREIEKGYGQSALAIGRDNSFLR
jgi:hypothetical protein